MDILLGAAFVKFFMPAREAGEDEEAKKSEDYCDDSADWPLVFLSKEEGRNFKKNM